MTALVLTDVLGFMSHLLLKDTFDNFSFIECEIVTFNTFRIDGYLQKKFFVGEQSASAAKTSYTENASAAGTGTSVRNPAGASAQNPAGDSSRNSAVASADTVSDSAASRFPEQYSRWKDVREYCLSLIRGKRTPLSFYFIFSLTPENIARTAEKCAPGIDPASVQGLYINIRYDGTQLVCTTGTSFTTFIMDKTLEHAWDDLVKKFFTKAGIPFEE